ncbi:MAG: 4Fe-4S dicluster domain-containing protein [Candidatus Marinimicrobia bacterium]|nr:4Fe-4S dicluster domain-containing protein [Candidatus Neomarinimicrobiota bacterium]MBL7046349.1 4Fe-4S dicluster domain-containing protein [Candidatus Neomarinimicrobiota bacterium]
MQSESVIVPDHTWLAEVGKSSGENASDCYQCLKCSSGCPVTFAMDYLPHQIIHMIRMGLKDEVLKSSSIWLCTSCETCTTRCPNNIDIAKIMDAMRMTSIKSGLKVGEKRVPIFHNTFLSSIKSKGKVYELGMIGKYTLKSGDAVSKLKSGSLFDEAKLGWQMFKKGKLKLFPKKIKGRKEIKRLFKKTGEEA